MPKCPQQKLIAIPRASCAWGLLSKVAIPGATIEEDLHSQLGLVSLARLDPVRLAAPILEDLSEEIDQTVALAMWGNHGATCVRWVETGGPVTVTLRTGVVLPLTTSATGLAFSAFYHSNDLQRQLDSELLTIAKTMSTRFSSLTKQLETQLNEIREHGISRANGSLIPGINGFSAPVFDHSGNMVAAITSLGTIGHFDMAWDSQLAVSIKAAAATLSIRLGFTHATKAP